MSITGETRKNELREIENSLNGLRKIYNRDSKGHFISGSTENDSKQVEFLYRKLKKTEGNSRVFATNEDIEIYNIAKRLEDELRSLNEKLINITYQKGDGMERILV